MCILCIGNSPPNSRSTAMRARFLSTRVLVGVLAACIAIASAVEVSDMAHKKLRPDGTTWMKWHMSQEHDLDDFDADTFFKMHDFSTPNEWDERDILDLYGLLREHVVGDGSGMGEHLHEYENITPEAKTHVVNTVLKLIDQNKDRKVSRQEFADFIAKKGELPDFGYGVGHHFDFEKEYERHHWNKFHAKNDPDVKIKHPEDTIHEILHHAHEIEESHDKNQAVRKVSEHYQSEIQLKNVPSKYRAAGAG